MEGTAALIVIGAASSFVVGRYAANMTIAVWRRRANLIGEELSLRSLLLWRLRNGFRWCSSAADILLGNERVAALADEYVLALSSRGQPRRFFLAFLRFPLWRRCCLPRCSEILSAWWWRRFA